MRCLRPRRNAFTLLELLVVMAIIMTLVSLLISAAFRVLTKAYQVRNRNEIAQLDSAIGSFCSQWNVPYMPSSIILNDGNPQSVYSQFLMRMWRRYNPTVPIPWNGTGQSSIVLQGQHCLVFFLGGIQSNGACQGFSPNPSNPADPSSMTVGPLFEFRPERLKKDGNGMLYYMDTYNLTPYAYFSAGLNPNGYSASDCNKIGSLSLAGSSYVSPYYYSSGNYLMPNSWQIISAGNSGQFGPGSRTWGIGAPISRGQLGWDNQANFATNLLMSPP